MWACRSLFRFLTIYLFDRQRRADGRTDSLGQTGGVLTHIPCTCVFISTLTLASCNESCCKWRSL